jgi:integrase
VEVYPMPTKSPRVPSYRRHVTGQAICTLRGRDFYLGKYGSDESKANYDRLIAEFLARGRTAPVNPSDGDDAPTIAELMLPYLHYVAQHYRLPSGAVSNQVAIIKLSLKVLRRLYGDTPAKDFGPLKLKACRTQFVEDGLSRRECNRRTRLIVQFFAWAVSEEMIPATNIDSLRTVKGLQAGRTEARETAPIEPVSEADVQAVLLKLPSQVAAMILVQQLTGMRPQEIVQIRTSDIDRTGSFWEFIPRKHKTQYRGKRRIIMIGPRAQAILAEWLRPDAPESPLFSPRDRMSDLSAQRREARRSPLTPSQRARKPKVDRKRPPGDAYTTESYRRAIHNACDAAGIPRWSPNRIRHQAGTRLRSEAGLDVASVVLGHASPDMTLVYAERDLDAARAAMEKLG